MPVSLTAYSRANVGGVLYCVLPPWGLLTGSELHMGETQIQSMYKLFAHEQCRPVENFIVGLFIKFDNYDENYIFRHWSFCLIPFCEYLYFLPFYHLQPGGCSLVLPVSDSWPVLVVFSIAECSYQTRDFIYQLRWILSKLRFPHINVVSV